MDARYEPGFLDRSPMLETLREAGRDFRGFNDWPSREALQALLTARGAESGSGRPLQLAKGLGGGRYEERLYLEGELEVRERNWHDLFNVLAWLAYPRAKRALNRRHFAAAQTEGSRRGPARDALTLFDESGAIVVTRDRSLLDALRNFEWKRLFCERRADVCERMRFYPFGHALCEKALEPYVGMTAHALLIEGDASDVSAADALVAGALGDERSFLTPRALAPLPVLGVPGWWRGNEAPSFYDDTEYFRPGRSGRSRGRDD